MKAKVRKLLAGVMAAMMVVSVMPAYLFSGVATTVVKAAGKYDGFDLSTVTTVGTKYCQSLNFETLSNVTYKTEAKEIEGVACEGNVVSSNDSAEKTGVPTKGAFKMSPTKGGDVSLYFKVNKGKTYYFIDSEGTVIDKYSTSTSSEYLGRTFTLEKDKVYYIYAGGSKIAIYGLYWNADEELTKIFDTAIINEKEAGTAKDAVSTVFKGEYGNGVTFVGDFKLASDGGDETWPNTGGINNALKSASGDFTYEGSEATSLPTTGAIKYTPVEDGEFTVGVKINKHNDAKKPKPFAIIEVNNNDATDFKTVEFVASTGSSQYKTITCKAKAGYTYYMSQKNGGATYFELTIAEGTKKKLTPWEEIDKPVIDKVSTDEDGNILVEFTAKIDAYLGAQKANVTMFYEGHEVSTTTLTKQGNSVKFSPLWSGDYSFVVSIAREGEEIKSSAEYKLDGYVLPVKKPIVEMAQNLGGAVYLDWINVESADVYNVYYKESTAEEYTEFAKGTETANATFEGLTAGSKYDFKIEAVRNSDNFVATYELKDFAVTAEKEQNWNFGTVGSAQETHATITDAAGTVLEKVDMSTKDEEKNKKGITIPETKDIVNTDKTVSFKATGNGKLSDGEEGFQYYYTMLNPNTDNFELTATFELTELYGGKFDNQTGFGIIATDMLGYNYYGTDGMWIKCKQLNSIATNLYSVKANFLGQRIITGYTSSDTTSVEGVTRATTQTKVKDTTPNFEVGAKYTFTLKKTDEGFVSVVNGEEIVSEDTSILSVQEDGSFCVGLFTSRNAGVKITDIKFSTSESKGVTSVEKVEKVTPNAAILSSGTTGVSDYEYIYLPNVDGNLEISDNTGKTVYSKKVEKNKVVRVNIPLIKGENAIKSVLTPTDKNEVTSTDPVIKTTKVTYDTLAMGNAVVYVSPDGKATGDGSKTNPYDIYTAVSYAAPGQTIVLMDGTYEGSAVTIGRSVSGTEDKRITMVAENDGKVLFEGIGLTVIGSYWTVYGIYVHYPLSVGIQVSGNNNIIDMCTVEGSLNTGIQISRSGSVDRDPGFDEKLWPTDNLIKNCESFDNCDAGRNDADGFAAKLTCGEGNVFYGCIGHNNVDDGWDLFAKAISGEIGTVTIENCVAYNNGWLTYEDTKAEGYKYGEGNGFKLGGNDMYGGHILKNSVTFGNIGKGITSNSCPDCKVFNCTSYGNAVGGEGYAFGFTTKASNLQKWEIEGLISTTTNVKTADELPYSFLTENNYIFNGKVSVNSKSVEVSDDWFKSVDLKTVPTRNADGTINMHDLLVKTDKAPAKAGATLDVSDAAKSVKPEIPVIDKDSCNHKYADTDSGIACVYCGEAGAWKSNDRGYWFEFSDGKYPQSAWKNINDNWYYFDAAGYMAEGWTEINGTWYYMNENGAMQTGWVKDGDTWYYLTKDGPMVTGWFHVKDDWYYMDPSGAMVSDGWNKLGNNWFYLQASGAMFTGWLNDEGTWYYMDHTGAMATGWAKDKGKWYYLSASGALEVSGWEEINGTWYYFDSKSGAMKTGWIKDGDTWYYLNEDGAMQTGWVLLNDVWYYLNASGAMETGWLLLGNTWYYLDNSGAMATGWVNDGGTWYYMNADGAMQTGWVKVKDDWYYMDASGAMKTGWVLVGSTWYYLQSSGAMAYDTTVDGYKLNADGAWVA